LQLDFSGSCLTPVILAIQKTGIGRMGIRWQPRKTVSENLFQKYPTPKRAGRVTQVGECLTSKYKKKQAQSIPFLLVYFSSTKQGIPLWHFYCTHQSTWCALITVTLSVSFFYPPSPFLLPHFLVVPLLLSHPPQTAHIREMWEREKIMD
jgi:hypothetical protein